VSDYEKPPHDTTFNAETAELAEQNRQNKCGIRLQPDYPPNGGRHVFSVGSASSGLIVFSAGSASSALIVVAGDWEASMIRFIAQIGLGMACVIGAAIAPENAAAAQPETAALANQVRDTEQAFARSMADRNHAAFVSFLSDEAVFMSEAQTLRGKQAIGDGWKRFYDAAQPPFSWEPERVEVLDSGTLALSTGPVRDPQGRRIGTFNSIWRREAGSWKIIFDKGCQN
jgi:ketosteroid isomerase-like protein